MRILISGSHGLIGKHLCTVLSQQGHELVRLVRDGAKGPQEIAWDPLKRSIDRTGLEGLDAVIHLGGVSIASGRWTAGRKKVILESRIQSTAFLADTLACLVRPPKVVFIASAIGFYGAGEGLATFDEGSPKGSGFLADVCAQWEGAALPLKAKGIRTVFLRFAPVLSPDGGFLKTLLTPFRLGLGGIVGSGKQVMGWVALEEVPQVVQFLIEHDDIHGAVNCVSTGSVTHADFVRTLSRVLGRPCVFAVPGFLLKLVLGEMAEEMVLKGARVRPTRLLQAGYHFRYKDLEPTLRFLLK